MSFMQSTVTVVHEQELTNAQGADRRMRQVVSWLKWNNFNVSVVVRGQHWIPSVSEENRAFLDDLGIEQNVDDLIPYTSRYISKKYPCDFLIKRWHIRRTLLKVSSSFTNKMVFIKFIVIPIAMVSIRKRWKRSSMSAKSDVGLCDKDVHSSQA